MNTDTLIVGLGVQGRKRKDLIENQRSVLTLDPYNDDADYSSFEQVDFSHIKHILLCVPDSEKINYLHKLLPLGNKNILVEKPLKFKNREREIIGELAVENNSSIYIAYNHRFEPSIVDLKKCLAKKEFDKLYKVRIFYGNGTAQDVKNSVWRDTGYGVLEDLGAHAFDIINFLFGKLNIAFDYVVANNFETISSDNIIINGSFEKTSLLVELSLVCWKNDFQLDVFTDKGSYHLRSLCKWGPASFSSRYRVLPSGRPKEITVAYEQSDPTWNIEHEHFFDGLAKTETQLRDNDWINLNFEKLQSIITSTG